MSENQKDRLRHIKQHLHNAMNGVASTSMRQRGLDYRVNFGLSSLSLKKMAADLGKNHELAQLMWAENIRDLRILATFVQPVETFTAELANSWVVSIQFPEEAEYAAMNLFQYLPDAQLIALNFIHSENEMIRYAGWQLLARIVDKLQLFTNDQITLITQRAIADISSNQLILFTGAMLGLKRMGRVNLALAKVIYSTINQTNQIELTKKVEILDDLKFEYEYYLNTSL